MKQVVSDVTFVLALGIGYTGAGFVWVALCITAGWLWAILVLAGKVRVGPRTMWHDETARRDFAARRVELKVSLGILACYLGAVIVAITTLTTGGQEDAFFWIRFTVLTVVFLATAGVFMALAMIWREDWERVRALLAGRALEPVLL